LFLIAFLSFGLLLACDNATTVEKQTETLSENTPQFLKMKEVNMPEKVMKSDQE